MPTYTPGKLVLKKESVPFDNDAWEYIARVETADGQILEQSVRNAITNFVIGCKADGIWTAIKASCILAGARTLAGALAPLAGTAPTNNNFVSGDYNRKTGLVANGSTQDLNSNRNANADPQDNQHMACWISQASSAGGWAFPQYIGAGDVATGSTHLGVAISLGFFYVRNRNGDADTISASASATGFAGSNRASSANYLLRLNSANTTFTRTSQTPVNRLLRIFAGTNDIGVISQNSNGRLAFYSIGESLDLAALDTRVTALINAFAAAIP
jgi:hypothetical protein